MMRSCLEGLLLILFCITLKHNSTAIKRYYCHRFSGLAERRGSASRLGKRGAGSSSTPSLEEEKVTRETLEAKRKKEGDQAEATLLSWLEEPQASKMPKVATIRATSVSADSLRQFADQFPKNNLKE